MKRRDFNRRTLGLLAAGTAPLRARASENNDIHTSALPTSGERLAKIGMGTWITFDVDARRTGLERHRAILQAFFDGGGQMIDSSPMYGRAQQMLGQTLPQNPPPAALFSATKIWIPGRELGEQQLQHALKLWGLERFDLVHVHNLLDWRAHLQTLRAWKQSGHIRYLGMTTSHGRRHDELAQIMRSERPDFVQFSYNLHNRAAEQRLLPLAQDLGIAVVINRPFQTGGLFSRLRDKPLPSWAADLDCAHWSQLLLKFIIAHPAVHCTIPATSNPLHMQENMRALQGPLPDVHMRAELVRYYARITA